jgi:hypothetical protein
MESPERRAGFYPAKLSALTSTSTNDTYSLVTAIAGTWMTISYQVKPVNDIWHDGDSKTHTGKPDADTGK